jgi:hypothetical protein
VVYHRDFWSAWPSSYELNQEFVLFENLFHDAANERFLKLDDNYEEEIAVAYHGKNFNVRRVDLLRFAAAKGCDLLFQFEIDRYSDQLLCSKSEHISIQKDDESVFTFYGGPLGFSEKAYFSRTLGKKLYVVDQNKYFNVERQRTYEEFVLSRDPDGNLIKNTCDPDTLANYFGANPGAPHYLTPVFFKRSVLDKYYDDPNYNVSDGMLQKQSLWSMRMDNDHPDHVAAFLGDLGRDLPNSEQRHWSAYNIPREDRKLSETNVRRAFLGEFTDAKSPEFRFVSQLENLNKTWKATFGWPLFKPLHAADRHIVASLRIPHVGDLHRLDDLLIRLAKILIDSINVEEISKLLDKRKDEKSLALLIRLLTDKYGFSPDDLEVLRNVQALRSQGAAHRKGSNYESTMKRLKVIEIGVPKFAAILVSDLTELLTKLATIAK